jgi:hypothetical protein
MSQQSPGAGAGRGAGEVRGIAGAFDADERRQTPVAGIALNCPRRSTRGPAAQGSLATAELKPSDQSSKGLMADALDRPDS